VANSANGDKLGKYVLKTMQIETDFSRENLFLNQYIVYAPTKYSLNKMYAYKDGIQSSLITSESYYDYYTAAGTHGELSLYLFSDKGNLGENASNNYNYKTEISYLRNKPTMTLFSLPESYTVTGNSGKLYRKTEAVWFDNFATQLKEVRQIIGNGDTSKVTLGYDRWGNLSQKELPAKNKADRMWYKYEYDKHYHLFPVKVSDKLGYSSTLSNYDYRFGIPRTTTDMNGNISTTTLDNLGRIVSITGPNEYDPNDPAKHTIKFEYYPGAVTKNTNGTINNPAYAVTRHYDPLHPTDSIVTVTFVDGFGRPVQVKKDAVINGESKMIVSGRTRYDAFGRAVESYYPTVDELSNRTTFKREYDNYKTVNTYDVLDRVLTTRLPDDATTTMSYGIAAGKLVTTVVDAEGGKQQTFTNGSGLTVKTLQYKHVNPDTVLTTLFDYDGVNQLVKVTDDAGKITESIYDLAGRRTQVTHPASGITKFEYDVAGNMIAKQTANMLANNGNKKIQYFYAYNRLDSIVYPDHPENNVKYTYGAANDPVATRRGRLVSQEDGSGAQEFSYGKQGELTQVRRTLVIPNQAVATYVTGWKYDSWNRLLEMTYPDGEKVNYSYNTGGLLTAVASSANTYVSNILYDKFEQRTNLTYGNGAVTTYQYNPANRQLNNLSVVSNNNTIMNNAYHYDKVSNVTKIINTGASADNMGGAITHNYGYDKLYRLTSADGQFRGVTGKKADYVLTMRYDNMHNITYKKQEVVQQGIKFDGVMNAGYELNYAINANNSQQIANIADASYRADRGTAGTYQLGEQSGDEVTTKAEDYGYDANGNLIYVLKGTRKADSTLQVTGTRRLLWDEENRLLALSDNGYVSNYWYDAAGERVVKQSGGTQGIQVNGVLSAARTETTKFTAYISPYLVVSNGGNYTKHIYMGSQRISSKLSNSGIFAESPVKDTLQSKYQLQTSKIKERFDTLGVKYSGVAQASGLASTPPLGGWGANPSGAGGSYFYHSDHLGSSSLITDGTGHTVQHIEYIPFGETFIEERNSTWNTPYKFNAKELDEETGLYYYGARYYDPRTSVWLSVDPLAEKNVGSTPYAYCANNPIRYIDPTGMDTVPNKEIWGYDLIRYSTDGLDASNSVFDKNSSFTPMPATESEREAGVNFYEMREITDGENRGNYLATANYGYSNDGIRIYEDKFIVGKNRIDDFRSGDRESGRIASLVRFSVNVGGDGRKSVWENGKAFLKEEFKPLNLLFSLGTRNPKNLLDYSTLFRLNLKTEVKISVNSVTKAPIKSMKVNSNIGSKSNPLKGKQIYNQIKKNK
jgi:RHS repeat-associated protein